MACGPRRQNLRQASGNRVCTNRKLLLHTNCSLEFHGEGERTLHPTDTEGTSRTWVQLVRTPPLALCALVGGGVTAGPEGQTPAGRQPRSVSA